MTQIALAKARILGFTEAGKIAYGLNPPLIVREFTWRKGAAMLARKDGRWLLSVVSEHHRNALGDPEATVYGIDEASVNRDARDLGMSAKRVAEYEAEGMLRKWGWDG